MANTAKIACSLDRRLLDRVEKMRARTGESRSALIERALASLTEEDARRARVHRYIEAYRESPETAEEQTRARTTARAALAGLRWENQ